MSSILPPIQLGYRKNLQLPNVYLPPRPSATQAVQMDRVELSHSAKKIAKPHFGNSDFDSSTDSQSEGERKAIRNKRAELTKAKAAAPVRREVIKGKKRSSIASYTKEQAETHKQKLVDALETELDGLVKARKERKEARRKDHREKVKTLAVRRERNRIKAAEEEHERHLAESADTSENEREAYKTVNDTVFKLRQRAVRRGAQKAITQNEELLDEVNGRIAETAQEDMNRLREHHDAINGRLISGFDRQAVLTDAQSGYTQPLSRHRRLQVSTPPPVDESHMLGGGLFNFGRPSIAAAPTAPSIAPSHQSRSVAPSRIEDILVEEESAKESEGEDDLRDKQSTRSRKPRTRRDLSPRSQMEENYQRRSRTLPLDAERMHVDDDIMRRLRGVRLQDAIQAPSNFNMPTLTHSSYTFPLMQAPPDDKQYFRNPSPARYMGRDPETNEHVYEQRVGYNHTTSKHIFHEDRMPGTPPEEIRQRHFDLDLGRLGRSLH